MRVLLLAQFLPPAVGGTEQHVWSLAKALAVRGHDVTLLGFKSGDEQDTTVSDGVRIIRVPSIAYVVPGLSRESSRPFALPMSDPLVRRAIDRELSRAPYDVIHAHNWIVNSALGPAAKRRVPIVMTLHDYGQVCATFGLMYQGEQVCATPSPTRCTSCATTHYGPLRGPVTVAANAWSARRRSRGVAQFAAVSTAVSTAVSPDGGVPWPRHAGVQARVIPNFIADGFVADPIMAIPPDAPLLYVGALTRNKGVDALLDAYRSISGAPELLLAGRAEPDDRRRFPDGARWLGEVPYAEVRDLMNAARAVVVPSVWQDPCPTVVLEAMAVGRPVVAAASGGIPDLVQDGVTGILVRPGDAAALAGAIERVLGDDQAARAFGIAGRNRAREFTVSATVERIEHMYADAAAGR